MTDWAWLEEIEKRIPLEPHTHPWIITESELRRLLHAVKVMRDALEQYSNIECMTIIANENKDAESAKIATQIFREFWKDISAPANEALEQAAKGEG